MRLEESLLKQIDETLGGIVERDPAKTAQNAPQTRPGS